MVNKLPDEWSDEQQKALMPRRTPLLPNTNLEQEKSNSIKSIRSQSLFR